MSRALSLVKSRPSEQPTAFGSLNRSQLMARIRGTGNRTTELRTARLLREHRITGWRRRARLVGKPDFMWRKERVLLFVDGCFWHGHQCGRNLKPKTNSRFWVEKIATNCRRDRLVGVRLRRRGDYPVDFTWEREWRVRAQEPGLPVLRTTDWYKTATGAILVERDEDVPHFTAILDGLAAQGRKWAQRLRRILSLETAKRMLDAGDARYGRIETWPANASSPNS